MTDLSSRAGANFTVNFSRTFNLGATPVGRSLRLRVSAAAFERSRRATRYHSVHLGRSSASLTITPGRFEARLAAAGEDSVTIGAKLTFSGTRLTSAVARPPEFSSYLKAREGLVVVTNRVNELAHALAGPSANARSVVLAFWNYLLDDLACGAIHYDQIRAEFAMRLGSGDRLV